MPRLLLHVLEGREDHRLQGLELAAADRGVVRGEELSGVRVLRIDTAGAVLLWRSDTVRVVLGKEEP
jgi:hypothetical protein